jgi:ribose transport system ATP-binding protein
MQERFYQRLNNCENIALASLRRFDNLCFQNKKKKICNAQEVGKKVGLIPNDPYFMTSALSGGNQQKVILAKWLSTDADILVFDEPTKGIDVGSKEDIYALMEDLLVAGKSIIMISSELPEIKMSDRVIVMREGRIAAVLNRNEVSESLILTYAIGN